MERIERAFRPEFINRLDDVIVFRHLTVEDLKAVVDLELKKVRERLLERGLKLELTDSAKEFIIKKGSNTDFGARPLRRAVENFVEDPLSEELLKGEFQGKDTITVDTIKDDEDKPRRLDFKGSVTNHQQAAETAAAQPAEAGAK
jgi:ATP-dependent Clp protease ATP-binding subunit ClpC